MTRDLVMITGTSGGLGAGFARTLIDQGFDVVGVARRSVSPGDLGVERSRYNHVQADLADIDGIGELVGDMVSTFGKPFGLINNSALGADGMLPTMHNSEIEAMIAVNVTAPIVMTKYVVRHMLSARRGRIINVSSVVARTGYRGLAAYGATKAAMEGFTRSLARDVGRRKITVNAIAPGFLATEMTSGLDDSNLERIANRSALNRVASVEEVAASAAFLMSVAGAGVTGTVVTVDAGGSA